MKPVYHLIVWIGVFFLVHPLQAQSDWDLLQDIEWEVEMREFNEEVQRQQRLIDQQGYTPEQPETPFADRLLWLVMPSMGYQWNREGGFGEVTNGNEGVLSAGDMLNFSYGLMIGAVRQYGGYIRYRYAHTDDPWVDMYSHQIRAGLLYRSEKHLILYGGLGMEHYEYTNYYTKKQVTPGQPLVPTTGKDSWMAVEGGLIGCWGRILLSGGMSYSFSGGTFDGNDAGADIGFDFGIGFTLGGRK